MTLDPLIPKTSPIDEAVDIVQAALEKYHPLCQEGRAALTDEQWDAIGCSTIADVSALDGFFNAVISAPNMIMPSKWMGAIWGEPDCSPTWDSMDEYQVYAASLMLLYNRVADDLRCLIVAALLPESDTINPISSGQMWAHGYMQGVKLWETGEDKAVWEPVLEPLSLVFTYVQQGAQSQTQDELDEEIGEIASAVVDIYEYFLNNRLPPSLEQDRLFQPGGVIGTKRGFTKPIKKRRKSKCRGKRR